MATGRRRQAGVARSRPSTSPRPWSSSRTAPPGSSPSTARAWGRKGRIAVQIFGSTGSIVYDQERLNEVQLYTTDIAGETQGFRTILAAPHHPPYDRFIPAPGHSLGFNDLKTIECRALVGRIRGEAALAIDFEEGVRIERTVDAIARSAREGTWIDVRA